MITMQASVKSYLYEYFIQTLSLSLSHSKYTFQLITHKHSQNLVNIYNSSSSLWHSWIYLYFTTIAYIWEDRLLYNFSIPFSFFSPVVPKNKQIIFHSKIMCVCVRVLPLAIQSHAIIIKCLTLPATTSVDTKKLRRWHLLEEIVYDDNNFTIQKFFISVWTENHIKYTT